MSILDYIRSLAPVYERRELVSTLQQLQDEHNETLMPLIGDMRELFSTFKFRSDLYAKYEQSLRRHVRYNTSAIEMMLQSLEQLQKNFPFLEKEVKRLFSIQFSTVNITYDRVNLMRYIEMVAFYIRYARKFLLALIAAEAQAMGKGTPSSAPPAEREYIENNLAMFAQYWDAVSMTEQELRTDMARVTNAEVNEETHELAVRNLGAARLGSSRMGINWPTPTNNVLFSLGKYLAEMQVKKYKAAQEELYALQLRLQELREMAEGGQVSPKLQRFIEATEERIAKLNQQIEKFEEDNKYE